MAPESAALWQARPRLSLNGECGEVLSLGATQRALTLEHGSRSRIGFAYIQAAQLSLPPGLTRFKAHL